MDRPEQIRAVEEHSTDRGLVFRCDLAGSGMTRVSIDWADYNLWCPDGALPPERLVEAVIATMLEHGIVIPESFDAARVRYHVPDADRAVTAHARP